jgi:ribosomal protein L7/L12
MYKMHDWFGFVNSCTAEEFLSLCEACKHRRAADKELLSNGLTPKENYLVTINKRIEAIKALRARTGMGLGEAKRFVDNAKIVQLDDL